MSTPVIEDVGPQDFHALLNSVRDIVQDLYHDIGSKEVYQHKSRDEVYALFDEGLPDTGTELGALVDRIKTEIIPHIALHYSPNFYAWVTSNPTQASIIGDMIATALNVNATTWFNAPAASELEQRVIKWICEFIDYTPDANGVLLSGGSASNFTAIRTAIQQKCPYEYHKAGFDQARPLRIYTSEQNHFCIDRAIASLGVGTDNLVKVKVDTHYRIDLQELHHKIEGDLSRGFVPIAVVANTGTVNTGAVDPILELSQICKQFDLWLHLDAAYGGFAASCPELRKCEFNGLEMADSIAIDLHKWLFVPFECGALLMRNPNHLKSTFSLIPAYQKFQNAEERVDFSEYSLQQSRSFKALKVWMNFKAYGTTALKASIRHSAELMYQLGESIDSSNDFELFTPVSLSVVCFRYAPPNYDIDLDQLNQKIIEDSERDGRIFIRETKLKGKVVLRACCTNFRREKDNIIFLLDVLRELGIRNIQRMKCSASA